MGLWERYVVPPLIACGCATKPVMKQRAKIVPRASGRVVEIGCGSGTNFAMYDRSKVDHLTAIEPAPGMVKRAQKCVQEGGYTDWIDIVQTGAEALPLADDSTDTAVITFVLCTIPDWRAALAEVRRVLKPGGTVLFSEHGLAPDEKTQKWQRRWEPAQKALFGGCHITRDPTALLTEAGFTIASCDTMYLPGTPKVMGFQYWGHAHPN